MWKISSRGSRVFHKSNIEECCQRAFLTYRKGQPTKAGSTQTQGTIYVRFDNDICTLSVDTSGELLYKRGNKEKTVQAPIRESLAAALLWNMLTRANLAANKPWILIDPLCGSGTFLSEARNYLSPNTIRSYAFESFPLISKYPDIGNRLVQIKKSSPNISNDESVSILNRFKNLSHCYGLDASSEAIQICKKNLVVRNSIHFFESDALQCQLPEKMTLALKNQEGVPVYVVTNPPYNMRLSTKGKPADFFNQLIKNIQANYQPQGVTMLVPRKHSSDLMPAQSKSECSLIKAKSFKNGGIAVDAISLCQ